MTDEPTLEKRAWDLVGALMHSNPDDFYGPDMKPKFTVRLCMQAILDQFDDVEVAAYERVIAFLKENSEPKLAEQVEEKFLMETCEFKYRR